MRAWLIVLLLSLPALAQESEPLLERAQLAPVASLVVGDGHCAVLGVWAHGREQVWSFGADATGTAPSSATVFEIGSVSKVFTGLLLADAVERGEVAWDDTLTQLLPDVALSAELAPLTLGQLVTHTSGLRRLPGNFLPSEWSDPYADYGEPELLAYLAEGTLQSPPGKAFAYSNLGMGLAAWVLARRLDERLPELYAQRILRPLGLTQTAVNGAPDVPGHTAVGPTPSWTLQEPLAGAGALRSSVADLLRFLRAHLDPSELEQGTLRRALRVVSQPRFVIREGATVGVAWLTMSNRPGNLVWHNGATGGFCSLVAFCPTRGVGLVLLLNVVCSDQATALGLQLLKRLAR